MKIIGLFAIGLLACAMPAAASAAATCDVQVSDVHIVRAKGAETTYFKANVAKGSCASKTFRLYEGSKLVSEMPISHSGASAISIPLPPNTNLSALGMSTRDASSVTALGPLPTITGGKLVFTGGTDIRPQERVYRISTKISR